MDIKIGIIDGIFSGGKVRVAFKSDNTTSGIVPLYFFDAESSGVKIGDTAVLIKTQSGNIAVPIYRAKE